MMYDISTGLLKNGSMTAKVYFLLLSKPMTVSEISRILYNGKVQLAHVNRIIDSLSKEKYIEESLLSREEKRNKGVDLRTRYWRSNYKPLIDYSKHAISERKKGSSSSRKEDLTEKEEKALQLIFNSKWFSKFYDEDFLKTQHGEITYHNKILLSDSPIRFFAFMVEEMFAIRKSVQPYLSFSNSEEDILKENDFDLYVSKNQHLLNTSTKLKVSNAFKRAKRNLGNYESTNTAIDYYLRDYTLLFVPEKLAEKMSTIGRVPLTVFIAFKNAII